MRLQKVPKKVSLVSLANLKVFALLGISRLATVGH